jgi:hypothetical protein
MSTDTESAPLTPATINAMSPEEWGKTFMPSLMDAPAPDAPAAEPEEAPAEDAGALRGPDGKFVSRDAPVVEDAPPTDAPTEPEAPAITLPFMATGADDAPIDATALAAMKVTLKANGAEVVVPLPDLVRQAQSAAGASRQANELRATMTQRDGELAQLRSEQQLLEQALVRALTDDDARAALAREYASYTSPEAELARIRAEQAAQAQQAAEAAARDAQQSTAMEFMGTVRSAFESLLTTYPEVTPQELLGQFNFDTAQWAVNGVIPPERYPEVQAYVSQSLTAYAQQRHNGLVALRTKADAAAKAAQDAARVAKTTMAAAVRPMGTTNAPASGKPAITTLKDATAYALGAFGSS